MDLKIYDIIQGPIVSDKASKMVKNLNRIILKVHPKANKPKIKEAVEKLFDVKVKDVRVMIRKGKNRMFKRKRSTSSDQKRAIISLKPGYSINNLAGTAGAPVETMGQPNAKE